MTSIGANSVLPADRQAIVLRTADSLTLHGELASPTWCEPVATIICIHPLTVEGGSMESHLIRKISWRLPALAGIAVLRFNMRGAGAGGSRSEGEFDEGRGEGLDLGAAMAFVRRHGLPDPWLVGWSFGTDVILKAGARPPVVGAVLLSPPARFTDASDYERWATFGRPVSALIPEFDDYLRMPAARETFADLDQMRLTEVAGAGHLWVGERHVRRVLDEIVAEVAPGALPLAREWSGPMQRWSDL